MTTSPTKELATFAVGLTLERVPAAVVAHAKRCVADTLCCGLFGSRAPEGRAVASALREVVGLGGPASLWGTGAKMDPGHAALANGIMVESLTMDDLHNRSTVHPGSITVPAAVATAQWTGEVDGKRLLAAIIAGYETAIRVGMGVSPSCRVRGFHPVGICGAFGAAAVAGKLLGLDEEQMVSALGNAGSQGAGLMSAQFGFMTQRLHAGKANHSGILAAFLARAGYTGTTNVLEAEYGGFLRAFADEPRPEKVTAGLGELFETLDVGLRPYACAGSVCTTIDAVKELRATHGIEAENVARVTVTCNHNILEHCGWKYRPDSIITAQMNIPYGAAVTLLEGDAGPAQYTEEKISDPRIVELASRVGVVHDPELDAKGASHAYYVHVAISSREGRDCSTEVYWAKGTPSHPLSDQELAGKWHGLADGVVGPDGVDRLIDLVQNLEGVGDLSKLFRLLE